MGVPVRITLGRPPRWFPYEHEHIRQLAPPGWVFRIDDWDVFRRKYRWCLHRQTAPRLQRMFDHLSRKHGGARLVLLCWEADPADCHRGLFSAWWFEQTGQAVPEIDADGEMVEQALLFDSYDERTKHD